MWQTRLSPTVVFLSALWLGLGLVIACADGPTDSESDLDPGVVLASIGDLEQRVRVGPASPARGEQMVITSEVIHRGSKVRSVTSRICGLDLETELEVSGSLLMCAGYSMSGPMEPGDTLRSFDAVVVRGGPGEYTLRVRHLIEPEAWVSVPIVVK